MAFLGFTLQFLSVVTLSCLLFLVLVDRFRIWRRLSHVPGPSGAGLSKLWMIRACVSGYQHATYGKMCREYGSLVRIGPNNLLTSDAELMRRMNAPRSDYRRGLWYNAMRFKPGHDNVLSMQHEGRHDELRRKMAAGYSGKENPGLEHEIDNRIMALIDLINRKYVSTDGDLRRLDFGRTAQYFTLDTISAIAFDSAFGDLAEDRDVHDYISKTEESMPALILLAILPGLHAILEKSRIMHFLAPSAKDTIGFGKIIGIAEEKVALRFGPKRIENQDMLGSFVRHGLTQEEAGSECVLQILAGSDTTATAIRVLFLYLTSNPLVLNRLRAEIDQAISNGQISTPITDAEAKALPYLQACIKEGLRICPAITGLMDKVVPPQGDTINDMFIPGGTNIGYCAIGVHHNTAIFGADASTFRPERWLTTNAEQLLRMERNNELIFGYGRFQCLGKNVAFIELNKVFVELLRHFDWAILDPTNPWNSFNSGVFLQSEMWMRVTKRQD